MSYRASLSAIVMAGFLTACPDKSKPAEKTATQDQAAQAKAEAPATPPAGQPAGQAAASAPSEATGKWTRMALEGKELFATIKTNQGTMVVRLFSKDAPKTVANFVGLATGEKEWTDPKTGGKTQRPLYNGVIFHRVIPKFMIQGGDPLGQGIGGPGYKFEDELQSGRTFDKPGYLAMANSGPNTNGSQFFITVAPIAHLNSPQTPYKHTIFGEVTSGMDVAVKISELPRNPADRPNSDVVIQSIDIHETQPTN